MLRFTESEPIFNLDLPLRENELSRSEAYEQTRAWLEENYSPSTPEAPLIIFSESLVINSDPVEIPKAA